MLSRCGLSRACDRSWPVVCCTSPPTLSSPLAARSKRTAQDSRRTLDIARLTASVSMTCWSVCSREPPRKRPKTEAASSVREETGEIEVDGQRCEFAVFSPTADGSGKSSVRRPAMLFVHGLAGNRHRHSGLARQLCETLGAVVMLPDVQSIKSPITVKEEAAIRQTVALAQWLLRRDDVNSEALVLGGFSAGGAVALEVAADLQSNGVRPFALAFMDPVPWKRTAAAAERLATLTGGILVLQSEPSQFTRQGAFLAEILPVLEKKHQLQLRPAPVGVGHVRMLTVTGAKHIDAESAGAWTGTENASPLQQGSSANDIKAEASAGDNPKDRNLLKLFEGEGSRDAACIFYSLTESFLLDALQVFQPRSFLGGIFGFSVSRPARLEQRLTAAIANGTARWEVTPQGLRQLALEKKRGSEAPRWFELLKARSTCCLDFFQGIQREEMTEVEADLFVEDVLRWGAAFPKLAQRLRYNKDIVRCELLREKLGSFMENCASREEEAVVAHIVHNHCESLCPEDVKIIKNLGTGSIAQVTLVNIRNSPTDSVLKMTWDEDKARFKTDFAVFAWFRSMERLLPLIAGDTDKFKLYLTTVLAKEDEILSEFDLQQEAQATEQGKMVLEKACRGLVLGERIQKAEMRVPGVKVHSKSLLEQEFAGGESLAQLWKSPSSYTKEATMLYLELVVPVLGRMLFNEGMTHADAHSGNLRYDGEKGIFWIIDWGAVVRLDAAKRKQLQQLVIELGLGEVVPLDASRASALSNRLADGSALDIKLWQHFFHPAKYESPEDFDMLEFEKSFSHNPQLVLTAETVAMHGQMIRYVVECGRGKDNTSWLGIRKSNEDMNLMRQWDTMASWNLLDAVKNVDCLQASRCIQDGQSMLAFDSDSEVNAMDLALQQNNLQMVSVLKNVWQKSRPAQSGTLEDRWPSLQTALEKLNKCRANGIATQQFARHVGNRREVPCYTSQPKEAVVDCDVTPGLTVSGAGGQGSACNGRYQVDGRLDGYPKYRHIQNSGIVIFKEGELGSWRIHDGYQADEQQQSQYCCTGTDQYICPGSADMEKPPSSHWITYRSDNAPAPSVTWDCSLLPNGTELQVLENGGAWCKVMASNVIGWVNTRDMVTVALSGSVDSGQRIGLDSASINLDSPADDASEAVQTEAALARLHRIRDEHASPQMKNHEYLAVRCAPPLLRERSKSSLEASHGNVEEALDALYKDGRTAESDTAT